jgi:hypothetical protein
MTTGITIEGGLLSPDIVERIGDLEGQRPGDFGLNPNRTMADAIAGDFAALCMDWRNFQSRLEDAREGESLTTLTRRQWVAPLLNRLGYEIETLRPAPVVDGRPYAISHRADAAEDAPVVHIVSVDQPLGERPAPGRGSIAPHALVQDYLNRTEQLWGIVTNGYTLRLLRDSSYFTRPSYVEFDLRQIFGGEQLDEFILLYRLVHRSRLAKGIADAPRSLIERYHLQALEQGDRIRDGLRGAVEQAILALGNGLLRHPRNQELRDAIQSGGLSTRAFYQQLLYLIYRFLFLMVAEERRLLGGAQGEAGLDYYRAHYSLSRLRALADEPLTAPERFDDLWLGLQTLFAALRDETMAAELGLPPLNGPLFEENRLDLALINNRDLLYAVRAFSSFTPPGERVRRRVNYSALDVEELGSVYEALLDYQPQIEPDPRFGLRFVFAAGNDRRSTGSYYTDRKLVNELVEAALVPVIEEKLREAGVRTSGPRRRGTGPLTDPDAVRKAEAALLSIRCLDPACGSGHFLLAAARRIGRELARMRAGGDEPSADAMRAATREAIAGCVYGVDRNELAVDLCKVALWIEGQAAGKPLSFLDHRVRHGDSLVGVLRNEQLRDGIPDAAYDPAPGDDKATARALKKRNRQEREGQQALPLLRHVAEGEVEDYTLALPDDTPEQVRRKRAAFRRMRAEGTAWWRRQVAAHLYTAAFFAPLTPGSPVPTSAMLEDVNLVPANITGAAVAIATQRAFFHWEQEFPEVFAVGGFDVALGNPPFVGGYKLSGTFGDKYRNYLTEHFAPFGAQSDLCAAFFRQVYEILRPRGLAGLVATNTIGQGDTRETGLAEIIRKGGIISYARRFVKWSGDATVEVNLVSWIKGAWRKPIYLDQQEVDQISSRLDAELEAEPAYLLQNSSKAFRGTMPIGGGFLLEPEEAQKFIKHDSRNKQCLFPFLNGQDLNTDPEQKSSRWIVNFFDWPQEKAKAYPALWHIVEEKVYPEREKNNRKAYRDRWWQFGERRTELYIVTKPLSRVLVRSEVSSHHVLAFVEPSIVYSHMLAVFALEGDYDFGLLQSTIHEMWVRRNASTMRTDIRYSPSDCFENFPFPQRPSAAAKERAAQVGGEYHEYRRQVMLERQEGLTKTYNRFHNPAETSEAIARLRALHAELDQAILACYGWADLEPGHGFHQNERGQTRYTVSDAARREILSRLLTLNLEVAAQEQGHDKLRNTHG